MNNHPDRNGWSGIPGDGVPILPAYGRQEIVEGYQQAVGYPARLSEVENPEGSNLFNDLLRYFWILVRHRWIVIGITAVFLCVGLILTFLSTPIYRASTTLQIDLEAARIIDTNEVQTYQGDEYSFYATQHEILKSRFLAEQVAAELGIEELQAFTKNPPSPWGKLWSRITDSALAGADAQAVDADIADAQVAEVDVSALQRAAAGRVQGGLSVQPVGQSRLVRLSFDSPDPRWAQQIVNAVATTFVTLTLDRRFEASSYARTFLEERLQEQRLKLEDSEEALVAYAQEQGIVNVDERRSLVSANLEALNAQLAETSRKRLAAEQLLRQVETTGGLSLPQILNDRTVQTMRERRNELSAQYQDKLGLFKPDYPEMQMLQSQIDELDRQIAASVDLVRASINAEYESAQAEQLNLAQQVEELKDETLDLEGRGIQYRILQREVDTNRQLYDGLLQRFKEVGVAGAVGTNNVFIVDSAQLPGGPYKPSLSKNLTYVFALGLLCGSVAAFGIEFLDDTFKVPEDIETRLGLPVLGVVPISDTPDTHQKALDNPRSPLSEAYRSLRTTLQFSTAEGAPRTLLITSSSPSEGKSTAALTLAKNFAELGVKVLLIDADLRNPSQHKTLNLGRSPGLSNYLAGDAIAAESFQVTTTPGLTFISAGPHTPNPAELLAGPKMASLLTVAREKYGIVVVDGPPILGLADAPLLASNVDGTLFVIEAGHTRRGVTKVALKRLEFARARIVGALLNKFNARAVGHTYGYGYGYGYSDKDYYGYGSDTTPKLTQTEA